MLESQGNPDSQQELTNQQTKIDRANTDCNAPQKSKEISKLNAIFCPTLDSRLCNIFI